MEKAADFLYDLPKNYALVFDIAHFVVCLQGERADIGADFNRVAKQNPLACWFSSMATCFAGGILVGIVCGEPLFTDIFESPVKLLVASLLWFLIFYSPRDFFYKLSVHKAVKTPLALLKGLYYPKKLLAGIKHARRVYKGGFLAAILVAVLKGNGSGVIKPFSRFLRGKIYPELIESMKPSVTTKYCALCTALYLIFPEDVTYLLICGMLVAMKTGPVFGLTMDPFVKIENAVCPFLFSGQDARLKKE